MNEPSPPTPYCGVHMQQLLDRFDALEEKLEKWRDEMIKQQTGHATLGVEVANVKERVRELEDRTWKVIGATIAGLAGLVAKVFWDMVHK